MVVPGEFGRAPNHEPCSAAPNKRPVRASTQWIKDAVTLCANKPLPWFVLTLTWLIIFGASQIIPYAYIIYGLINPILAAGAILAAYRCNNFNSMRGLDLFEGFRIRPKKLLIIGLITTVGQVLIVAVSLGFFLILVGIENVGALVSGELAGSLGAEPLLASMLGLLLMLPLLMAYWFAPAILILQPSVKPIAAIRASISACLLNLLPLLAYIVLLSLPIFACMFIAMINPAGFVPAALGFVLFIPVVIASNYFAYKDIFGYVPPVDPYG